MTTIYTSFCRHLIIHGKKIYERVQKQIKEYNKSNDDYYGKYRCTECGASLEYHCTKKATPENAQDVVIVLPCHDDIDKCTKK